MLSSADGAFCAPATKVSVTSKRPFFKIKTIVIRMKTTVSNTAFLNAATPTATERLAKNNSRYWENRRDRSNHLSPNHPNPRLKELRQFPLAHFKRYDPLFSGDYGLWRIKSGYIRTLTWNASGEVVPLGFWTAGDIVGCATAEPAQKTNAQTHPYEAQCLTTVTAEYLGNHCGFPKNMILAQLSQSNDLLRIAHCHQTEMRLLLFVCWLAEKFGQLATEGYQVDIKLTHQEIAESIGATRVTVSRLLKVLERKGKIRWTTQEKWVSQIALSECCPG